MGVYSLQIWSRLSYKSVALDESDIQILKTYVRASLPAARGFCLSVYQGQGPYAAQLKKTEADIKDVQKRINEKLGTLSVTSRKRLINWIQESRSRTLV